MWNSVVDFFFFNAVNANSGGQQEFGFIVLCGLDQIYVPYTVSVLKQFTLETFYSK